MSAIGGCIDLEGDDGPDISCILGPAAVSFKISV